MVLFMIFFPLHRNTVPDGLRTRRDDEDRGSQLHGQRVELPGGTSGERMNFDLSATPMGCLPVQSGCGLGSWEELRLCVIIAQGVRLCSDVACIWCSV